MVETPQQSTVPPPHDTSASARALEQRTAQAHDIVNKHVRWAVGAGIIPLPVVDMLALTAVNLRQLKDLAEHYGVPFSEHIGKSAISSLLGGISSTYLGRYLMHTLIKSVPILGTVASLTAVPLASAAITRAVGRLFIQHFETGGTLLSFDARAMRKHFAQEFERSRAYVAKDMPGSGAQPSA